MEKEPLVISNKSCKTYFLRDGNKVYFSGDFDSGNLQKAEQLSPLVYRVTPGFDKTRQTTRKTFFHFKTHGFKQCTVKFIVTRAYLLEQFIRQGDASSEIYHPVVRRHPHTPFEKLRQDVKIYYTSSDQPELSFSFTFELQNWVQFAFTYPYAYEDCQNLVNSLALKFRKHPTIYFHDEVLCRTSQTRKMHVITLSDRANIGKQRQNTIEGIFQEGQRPFKIDKPRVVISARVHPGETPSSYCMEGILRFLLNQKDYRSYLLRKNFQFVLIPMLNPEGVFQGMFRNDLNGQNLNRVYLFCDQKRHKSIASVKKYLQTLSRADFFFDLHAHPSRKGFFIYGNAFDQFLEQTEAQIFSKMIQYNCPYFQNLDCIYSQKAMVAKDKYDNYTKQGCARVFYHSLFKMIHSFTVQCGYFAPTKLNPYPPQRQFTIPGSDYVCTFEWQNFSTNQYTPESYMLLGKSILISIIDLFHINPYTRISTSDFKSINSLRKFTAQRLYNQVERFRLVDSNCYRKIRQVAALIEQNYYVPRFKAYGLTVSENYGMKHRKKSLSLNSRIYRRNVSQRRLKKREDEAKGSEEIKGDEEKEIPHKCSSEARLPFFSESIEYSKPSVQIQRKLKLINAQRVLENNRDHEPFPQSIPIKRKDHSFSRQHERQQVGTRIKKMEEQIITQLLKAKTGVQQKRNLDNLRVDRLSSFIKKQAGVKLPFIRSSKHEDMR